MLNNKRGGETGYGERERERDVNDVHDVPTFMFDAISSSLRYCVLFQLQLLTFKIERCSSGSIVSCCMVQACKQDVGDVNDAPTFCFGIHVCPSAVLRMAAAAAASVFKKRSNKKRARQRQLLTSCCVVQACKQEVGERE